jgi:hypothetical protein
MRSSNNFANELAELNSGKQAQSIDPFSEIKAAVRQFPITP